MHISQIPPDQLLTDRQVSSILGVSRSHLWAKVKCGDWPAPVKISERCTRWKSSAIAALIEKAG